MKIRPTQILIVLLLMASVACSKRNSGSVLDSSTQTTNRSSEPGAAPAANPTTAQASKPVDPAVVAAALKPPKDARLAIVVFEDLQCPACSSVEPLLVQAAQNYKIPLVRHDFVIPNHAWSPEAHIYARYFDTQSLALGEAYRHWIFENQRTVNKSNLRQMTDRFASEHKLTVPATVDPKGELATKVKSDGELGRALGINETPTIFIVSSAPGSSPTKVQDRSKLFEAIDQVKGTAESAKPPAKSAKSSQGSE